MHNSCSMARRPGELPQKLSSKPYDRAIDALCIYIQYMQCISYSVMHKLKRDDRPIINCRTSARSTCSGWTTAFASSAPTPSSPSSSWGGRRRRRPRQPRRPDRPRSTSACSTSWPGICRRWCSCTAWTPSWFADGRSDWDLQGDLSGWLFAFVYIKTKVLSQYTTSFLEVLFIFL